MQSVRSTACAATLYTKWRWLKNTFQSKCQTSNTVHKCSKHICPMHSQSARRTWPKSFPTLTLRLCWYNGRWKTSLFKSGKLDSINPFLKWLTQNEFFSWQKWNACSQLKAISKLFSISISIAGKTKNGRAKSTRWSVWQPCWLRHDARNAPSCFKSSPETMKPKKAGKMTQTSMCGSPNSIYLSNPQERASNKANNLIPSYCASCGVVWSHKTGTF